MSRSIEIEIRAKVILLMFILDCDRGLWLTIIGVCVAYGKGSVLLLYVYYFCLFVELDSGKLITWGSTDDLGQSYVTSGKHGVIQLSCFFVVVVFYNNDFSRNDLNYCILTVKETPEPFPLPIEASIAKAAAGWAHCVSATGTTDFNYSL